MKKKEREQKKKKKSKLETLALLPVHMQISDVKTMIRIYTSKFFPSSSLG